MTIGYYLLLLVLALLMIIPSRVQLGFFYLLCGYMLVLAGFRYEVGTDYRAYRKSFEKLDFWYSEVGFITIVERIMSGPFQMQMVFLVCAVIILTLILSFFHKQSGTNDVFFLCVFFFITLYYFQASMNVVRQFIAIGLFLWGLHFVVNKKWLKFHVLFFMSALFHSSVVIFYSIFLVPKIMGLLNTKVKQSMALCVAFSLMFVQFDQVIIQLLLDLPFAQYDVYANYMAMQYLYYDLSWKMLVILLGKFLLYQWLLFRQDQFIETKEQQLYFQLFFFAALLMFPLYPMLLFRRLLFYLTIVEVLMFSYFASKNSYAKYVLVSFALIYFFAHLLSGFDTPLPYRWNFSLFE